MMDRPAFKVKIEFDVYDIHEGQSNHLPITLDELRESLRTNFTDDPSMQSRASFKILKFDIQPVTE